MSGKITWATFIPLAGGFPIGAEQAIGTPPDYVITYDAFSANDSHYLNYLKKKYNYPDEKIINLDHCTELPNVDLVVSTPPCAGLSMLNACNDGKNSRGADACQNDWMKLVTDICLDVIKPKVMLFENAPGLYTSKEGKEIAEVLLQKSEKYGYCNSSYYTSTHLHGIPQVRRRTFFYFWKDDRAPELPFEEVKSLNLAEYMKAKPAYPQDNIIKEDLLNNEYFAAMNELYDDFRSALNISGKRTFMQQIRHDDKVKDLKMFMDLNQPNTKYTKFVDHAIKKMKDGKNYFDATPNYFGDDTINAIVGKTVTHTVHQFEDRYYSIGDLLYLMGYPEDFEILNPIKNYNHIAQNVPVCTGKFATTLAVRWLRGEFEKSRTVYNKYNNIAKILDFEKTLPDMW